VDLAAGESRCPANEGTATIGFFSIGGFRGSLPAIVSSRMGMYGVPA
jgi:hypothetical protein